MLQQTQVSAVISFFNRWMESFPSLELLAQAEEQEVLRVWEGLGYYSRARNILKAAIIIVKERKGCIPETYDQLVSLPGIGEYTASAILSIVYNQKKAVLDANVKRIICRIEALSSWRTVHQGHYDEELVASLEFPDFPGEFNAALMQFGQIVCKNKNPSCADCFFSGRCKAFNLDGIEFYPLSKKKQISEKQTTVYVFSSSKGLFLEPIEKGIGQGMWKFPVRVTNETPILVPKKQCLSEALFLKERIHLYTRYRDRLIPVFYSLKDDFVPTKRGQWFSFKEIEKLPVPAIFRQIIKEIYSH